jgi:hypothetical protein
MPFFFVLAARRRLGVARGHQRTYKHPSLTPVRATRRRTASTKAHNDANEAKQFFAENSATPSGGNATVRRRQYDC